MISETRPICRNFNLFLGIIAIFRKLLGLAVGLAESDQGVHVGQASEGLALFQDSSGRRQKGRGRKAIHLARARLTETVRRLRL